MALALLRENERLFTRAFETSAPPSIGRGVFTLWRLATSGAREAELLLAKSAGAKSALTKQIEAEITRLSADELRSRRNELAAHLSSLKAIRSASRLLRQEQTLQADLEHFADQRGIGPWFIRRQIAKALSGSVAIRFATANYEEAVEFVLREKLDPALAAATGVDTRRIIRAEERQFSPERQAAIRARIGKPTQEELDWGRDVSRRLDLQV